MIDLHIHTTATDGAHTPAEILQMCEKLGLDVISITDHNTADAYKDVCMPEVRRLFSGKILPGFEMAAHFHGVNIEVLGYGVPIEAAREWMEPYNLYRSFDLRRRRVRNMVRIYREKGFLPYLSDQQAEEILQVVLHDHHRGEVRILRDEALKNPANVALLTDPYSAENFTCFLRREHGNPDSPFFVSSEGINPSAQEVCAFIHAHGGIAIVAHPGMYSEWVRERMEELADCGCDGLEAYYGSYPRETWEWLRGICDRKGLLFSAGSDFHNTLRIAQGNVLGLQGLGMPVPEREILAWVHQLNLI